MSGDEIHALPPCSPSFGVEPDLSLTTTRRTLRDGDLLLLYTFATATGDGDETPIDARRLGEILRTHRHRTPHECVSALRRELGFTGEWFPRDATLLIAQRRG